MSKLFNFEIYIMELFRETFNYFLSNLKIEYRSYVKLYYDEFLLENLNEYYDADEYIIVFNGSPIIYIYNDYDVYIGYLNDPISFDNVTDFNIIKDKIDLVISNINNSIPYEHILFCRCQSNVNHDIDIDIDKKYFGFWNIIKDVKTGIIYK
jgi:hypothetical protein